jgi:peptidoglycan hydrolase-like protein with peptidoglycan-binding domain
MNTLRLGSSGAEVVKWQGIVGVPADGKFGPATSTATKTWQAARGLTPDGVVGPKTWAAAEKKGLALTAKLPTSFPSIPVWGKSYLGTLFLAGLGYGVAYTLSKRSRR